MIPLRPLSVGELLDTAVRTYRERFRTLVAAVAVPMVPVVVLQTLIDWSVRVDTDPFGAPTTAADVSGGEIALQLAGSLVNVVAVMLGTALATAACFRALSAAYVGGEVTWKESLAFARTRVWSVIGLTLLTSLGTIVGFLLCVVPGILAFTWWAVATPALLMEGLGAVEAMGRSRRLARQRFWPVLGAVVLSTFLAFVFQTAVATPLIGLVFTDVDGVVVQLVEAVVSLVAMVLVTPFTAAFTLALYVDLRVRFEGFDLYLWSGQGQVVPGHAGPTADPGSSGLGPSGFGPSGFGPSGFGPPTTPPPDVGPPSSLPPPPSPPPDGQDR